MSHTGGSYARREIKASENGEAVEMLRNAGGIPLCVTNTPELCTGIDSYNYLFGRTCNAYDSRYTAGGSSGGEVRMIIINENYVFKFYYFHLLFISTPH